MAVLTWDDTGLRFFETGVSKAVLYIPNVSGVYDHGYAWNGITAVTESPSGADTTPFYADNIKYLNLVAAEDFGAKIEAYTYPDAFAQCDGTASPQVGVTIAQQTRKTFGLAYRTKLGNDLLAADYGYKLHLVYGATAAPSERAYTTVNDKPEAITFSWAVTTTPASVSGYKATALLTIDSTKVNAAALALLETALYGSAGIDPRLPTPDEVIAFFAGTTTMVTPTAPTYVLGTHTITIPTLAGVVYQIDGVTKNAGAVVITKDTVVTAKPATGYAFNAVSDDDWFFSYT